MQAQGLLRNAITRIVARRSASSYGHGDHHQVATFNDLPSPQGSWKTHYDAKQRKYNAHLLLGVSFAIASIVVAKASGLVYLNYYPPARPADV